MVRSNNVDYKPKESAADAAVEVRRSVTFYPQQQMQMLMVRASFMKQGIDIDHTKTLNMLINLGVQRFIEGPDINVKTAYAVAEVLGLDKSTASLKKVQTILAKSREEYRAGVELVRHVADAKEPSIKK